MEIKDKELIAEIKKINEKLENIIKGWNELSDIQFNNSVNTFKRIVENKYLEGFLKMSSFNLFSILNEKSSEYLKNLVKKNTDRLESKEIIKNFIIRDSNFLRWIEPENITFSLITEIFEENNINQLSNIWLKEKHKLNFDELLKNEKLLDIFLSKNIFLSAWFKNIDITKLPDKFYKNEKYWESIFENIRLVDSKNLIGKLPQTWMKKEKLWKVGWTDAIKYYGRDIKKFINKEQLLSAKVINYFINKFNDYSLFNDYYNEIINNTELMEELLDNYKLLKYIKNEDFYKVRNIVMNRIKDLEEELEKE